MRTSFFMVVSLSICLLPGCTAIDRVATFPSPCITVEHGATKNLHVVTVSGGSKIIPAPGFFWEILNEAALSNNDIGAACHLVKTAPASRVILGDENGISGRTDALTLQYKGRVHWIIGNAPLVVAIGIDCLPEDADPAAMKMGISLLSNLDARRLVTKADLSRMVTDLFVYSVDNSSADPRHISLVAPQTVGKQWPL
jgi:hypothetical protein